MSHESADANAGIIRKLREENKLLRSLLMMQFSNSNCSSDSEIQSELRVTRQELTELKKWKEEELEKRTADGNSSNNVTENQTEVQNAPIELTNSILEKFSEQFQLAIDDFRRELSKYEGQIQEEMKKSECSIKQCENTVKNLTNNLNSSLKGLNRLVSQGHTQLNKFDHVLGAKTNLQPSVNKAPGFSFLQPLRAHPPFYSNPQFNYVRKSQNNPLLPNPPVTPSTSTVIPEKSPSEETRKDNEPEQKPSRKSIDRDGKVPEDKSAPSKSTNEDAPAPKIPKLTDPSQPPVPPNVVVVD